MSSNPSTITFRENTVKKIATNIKTGTVSRHPTKARGVTYILTGKKTGDPAPSVAEIKNLGVLAFIENPEQEEINSSYAIDVYALANREDGRTDWGILTVWAD